MAPVLRSRFIASALAGSLLAACPQQLRGQGTTAAAPASTKIGHIKLTSPLPFTPQDLVEPFGWRLTLIEDPEKKQTIIKGFLGSHVFTFYHDGDGKIRSLFSPLAKNDEDLCMALDLLKKERPVIFTYLNTTFDAQKSCAAPRPAPG